MSHLNIRMTQRDEHNLFLLKNAWKLDTSSEITRRALALAASQIVNEQTLSKEELLKNSKFIGSDETEEFTSSNYKKKLKLSLKRKHELQQTE